MTNRPKGSIDLNRMAQLVQDSNDVLVLWPASPKFTKSIPNAKVINKPRWYVCGHNTLFVEDGTRISHDGMSISLLDHNVVPNQYNDWYLFESQKDACEYVGIEIETRARYLWRDYVRANGKGKRVVVFDRTNPECYWTRKNIDDARIDFDFDKQINVEDDRIKDDIDAIWNKFQLSQLQFA